MVHRTHRKKPTRLALAAAVMMALGPISAWSQDTPSLEEMWEMIQAQQAEIERLKEQNESLRQQVEGAHTPQVMEEAFVEETVIEGDRLPEQVVVKPQPVPERDGQWRLNIYGHAMLDMGYQFGQNDPDWYDVVRPTKLPAFDNEFGEDGAWFSSVRQSRFGVSSTVPTRYGDLDTLFEFELFGVGSDAGQTTFRLRHAWGELGQFGAGQTHSTFMDIDVFPNSIEYWGPSGMVFYRNIQARWTPWSEGDSRFAVALEQPGGSGDGGRFADRVELSGLQGKFDLPDLTAHYRVAGDWGHFQAAGILRRIEWIDTQPNEFDLTGSETGWGVNLSTNLNLGRHVFRGSVTYGEAIQNYFNDGASDIGVTINLDGLPSQPIVGEAIPVLGLVAFLDLNWSDTWTSTVGYSLQDNDLPNGSDTTSFERGQYALANLLYHPLPNVFMGPEVQWAKRDNFGPYSSDDFRIQFSAKWSFNYLISNR